jgi:hypothetical protein
MFDCVVQVMVAVYMFIGVMGSLLGVKRFPYALLMLPLALAAVTFHVLVRGRGWCRGGGGGVAEGGVGGGKQVVWWVVVVVQWSEIEAVVGWGVREGGRKGRSHGGHWQALWKVIVSVRV